MVVDQIIIYTLSIFLTSPLRLTWVSVILDQYIWRSDTSTVPNIQHETANAVLPNEGSCLVFYNKVLYNLHEVQSHRIMFSFRLGTPFLEICSCPDFMHLMAICNQYHQWKVLLFHNHSFKSRFFIDKCVTLRWCESVRFGRVTKQRPVHIEHSRQSR